MQRVVEFFTCTPFSLAHFTISSFSRGITLSCTLKERRRKQNKHDKARHRIERLSHQTKTNKRQQLKMVTLAWAQRLAMPSFRSATWSASDCWLPICFGGKSKKVASRSCKLHNFIWCRQPEEWVCSGSVACCTSNNQERCAMHARH